MGPAKIRGTSHVFFAWVIIGGHMSVSSSDIGCMGDDIMKTAK